MLTKYKISTPTIIWTMDKAKENHKQGGVRQQGTAGSAADISSSRTRRIYQKQLEVSEVEAIICDMEKQFSLMQSSLPCE